MHVCWQRSGFLTRRTVSTGPVDAFLSWRPFVPLSRLTYCAYLCHYMVLLYNAGSQRAPGYLSEYTVVSTRVEHVAHVPVATESSSHVTLCGSPSHVAFLSQLLPPPEFSLSGKPGVRFLGVGKLYNYCAACTLI